MRVGGPDREEGASAVEYGLIAVAIAAVIALAAFGFGQLVSDLFGSGCDAFADNIPTASCDAPAGTQ